MKINNDTSLKEILSREDLIDRLSLAGSEEETLSILRTAGVEMTAEELHESIAEGRRALEAESGTMADGELSEEMLEYVAGGRDVRIIVIGLLIAGVSAFLGYKNGVTVGAEMMISGTAM